MGRAAERGRRRCLTARSAAGTRGGTAGPMRKQKNIVHNHVSDRTDA